MLRRWNFASGIIVVEAEYDRTLKMFEVFYHDRYLGPIYPSCNEDYIGEYEGRVELLNQGIDPVTDMWSDGRGHTCTRKGWIHEE